MIYTSYFANWRKFPQGIRLVSIALYPPRDFLNDSSHGDATELAPSQNLLRAIKSNEITEEQYTEEFNKQLSHIDPQEIKTQYDNSILLCYEKSTDFCHRHLVRKWLNDNKIECEELK